MWDYDGFIGKARLYFVRAQQHPSAEEDALAVWLLLGLEFLLRAPLAKVNPTLLAEPDAVMAAAGFPGKPDSARPKSIQTKTVILRLGLVIPAFDKERQDDATVLTGLRNEELHSSSSPTAFDIVTWLPQFTRVVDVVCAHLGLDPVDLVGDGIVTQGRALVDVADKRLEHEVAQRIQAARALFDNLRPEEISARQALITQQFVIDPRRLPLHARVIDFGFAHVGATAVTPVECPVCSNEVPLRLQAVRTTNERLDNDDVVHDVIYVAVGLSCPVCGLELTTTAEVRAAKITQQYVQVKRESLEERYTDTYEGEYGNE